MQLEPTESHNTPGESMQDSVLNTGVPEHFHELLLNPERAHVIPYDADTEQLRIGYVPGVMPGKWFNRWHERYSKLCPLVEIPLVEKTGLLALQNQEGQNLAHMVLLRPEEEAQSLDKDAFHTITLYREKAVVVFPKDHVLAVYDHEVPLEDLAEEFMLQDPATVPEWAELSAKYRAAHPQKLPQMRNTADAVELVAAGLGLLMVPMSVARFHHRKDLTYRLVSDVAEIPVNLVWPRGARTEEAEQIIQDFVGICRGRTAGSDRGSLSAQQQREQIAQEKELAKRKRQAANKRREERDRKNRNARKNGNARQHAAQKQKQARSGKKR